MGRCEWEEVNEERCGKVKRREEKEYKIEGNKGM
jgi:hypothetical protein